MGTARSRIHGQEAPLPNQSFFPARSPGPLGFCDAGDPNALVCEAGDTPGPCGSAQDYGALLCEPPIVDDSSDDGINACVMEVDLEKIERQLYAIAIAESLDHYTKVGIGGLSDGSPQEVESRAKATKARMLDKLLEAAGRGPRKVDEFIAAHESLKQRYRDSLQAKYRQAQQQNSQKVALIGAAIKVVSAVEFGMTCALKIVSIFQPAPDVIDIAYDTAKAGIDEYNERSGSGSKSATGRGGKQDGKKGGDPVGVMIRTGAAETGASAAENAFEWGADKAILTADEANVVRDFGKRYTSEKARLNQTIEKAEKRLLQQVQKGSPASKTARNARRSIAKAGKRLRKNRISVAKGSAGKFLSIVFLYSEIQEAWERHMRNWNDSN